MWNEERNEKATRVFVVSTLLTILGVIVLCMLFGCSSMTPLQKHAQRVTQCPAGHTDMLYSKHR